MSQLPFLVVDGLPLEDYYRGEVLPPSRSTFSVCGSGGGGTSSVAFSGVASFPYPSEFGMPVSFPLAPPTGFRRGRPSQVAIPATINKAGEHKESAMSKIFLGLAAVVGVVTAGVYGVYHYNLCSSCDGSCPIAAFFSSFNSNTSGEASPCSAKPTLSASCCALPPAASASCCAHPCAACAVACDGCPLCEIDCSACCDAATQAVVGGPALALKAARK